MRGIRLRVAYRPKPDGIDPKSVAGAEPGKRRIDAARCVVKLGRRCRGGIGTAVKETAEQGAVLAQNEPVIDQRRIVQKVGGSLCAVPELLQIKHGRSFLNLAGRPASGRDNRRRS